MQKSSIIFNLVYYWSELDRPDFLGESDTLSHGMCGEATQKKIFGFVTEEKSYFKFVTKKSLTSSYLHGPWARAMVSCACAMLVECGVVCRMYVECNCGV